MNLNMYGLGGGGDRMLYGAYCSFSNRGLYVTATSVLPYCPA
jgi:hypothetical protein